MSNSDSTYKNIVIFGGTTEGRELSWCLGRAGCPHLVCVATRYGEDVLPEDPFRRVQTGRMDAEEMADLLKKEESDLVIDATHVYAREVSQNIKSAAAAARTEYIRLKRDVSTVEMTKGDVSAVEMTKGDVSTAEMTKDKALTAKMTKGEVLLYGSPGECAGYLAGKAGNILLTTGSRTLNEYTRIEGLAKRVYVRVLPSEDSITECRAAGIEKSHIIAMQGPFSTALNRALINEYGIEHLVTKQSGIKGGYPQKAEAAAAEGISLHVIAPPEDFGVDMDTLLKMLGIQDIKERQNIRESQEDRDLSGIHKTEIAIVNALNKCVYDNLSDAHKRDRKGTFSASRLAQKETNKFVSYTSKHPGQIMIAATGSGAGKTTAAFSLIRSLVKRGYDVLSCKCGPDYIDPMYHKAAGASASICLDPWFLPAEDLRSHLQMMEKGHDITVIEGVMGLYDGIGGMGIKGSCYETALYTKTPIILMADAKGMGHSMVAMLKGYIDYDSHKMIAGIILNNISEGYYEKLRPALEKELPVPVLGYMEKNRKNSLKSRHLGLNMPGETDTENIIEDFSKRLEETVDVEGMIRIASQVSPAVYTQQTVNAGVNTISSDGPVLAVARDEAFCFYYQENLKALEDAGVRLREFSPLKDEKLPDGISGVLFGGGYPELYAKELSQNKSMRDSVRRALQSGMPSLAECGGFMYLHRSIETQDGQQYEMAGVIDEDIYYGGKLIRFGYMKAEVFGMEVKGHEFHYYESTDPGRDCLIISPRGEERRGMYAGESHLWGFPHLYYPSCPEFIKRFKESLQRTL